MEQQIQSSTMTGPCLRVEVCPDLNGQVNMSGASSSKLAPLSLQHWIAGWSTKSCRKKFGEHIIFGQANPGKYTWNHVNTWQWSMLWVRSCPIFEPFSHIIWKAKSNSSHEIMQARFGEHAASITRQGWAVPRSLPSASATEMPSWIGLWRRVKKAFPPENLETPGWNQRTCMAPRHCMNQCMTI